MRELVLMRGVSGSGKSTIAKQLADEITGSVTFSTDDYFMKNEQYHFDVSKLKQYHLLNQQRAESAMARNIPRIIIDNTNTRAWEMKPYVLAAQRHNYKIRIVETPPVDLSTIMDRQQSRTDIHKALPLEVVQGMLQRFEHNVTVDDILNS